MRALLLVNPQATTVSPRARDVITRALSTELKLDVAATRHRGHAVGLARQAAGESYELVIALGGDGTVNEVANGLLTSSPGTAEPPVLAVVPGGNANVFGRALGFPRDPVEATGVLLAALHSGAIRRIGLGRADDRYFTFCAGLGLDAEVIRAVEGLRAAGRRSSPSLYVTTALRHFFGVTDRRDPALRLERPGAPAVDHIYLGLVSNVSPWTYLGPRPVAPSPWASFDTGLDLLALRRLRSVPTLKHIRQFLQQDGVPPRGRDALTLHDLMEFTFVASRPIAFQVDGDYLGERERVTFRAAAEALRVVDCAQLV